MAEQRPKKSQLTLQLKQLSIDSGWDLRSLKEVYLSTIEDFDADAELPDDERKLGGELKVGHLIKLKGGDDSSLNTWEIKSVESERLWVERTGRRVEPEIRRVKFSDVEKIYTKS
ncbi:MAG: hypothetical protein F6K23_38185 [Okeania sp. SIO2C9]|uniref:hypothetical protein n=1 Tax=Okeania sp. SIO2C9 TaxID=2607791 RepID=UPI0013C00062|nr:hypothetical protein [Okeania sp. SIO2C9]NEQ78307.1 hypothetical protein [Okeania sp. SIO2C9]